MANMGVIITRAIIKIGTDQIFQLDKTVYQPTLSMIFCAIGASSASFSIGSSSSLNSPHDLSSSLKDMVGLTGYS